MPRTKEALKKDIQLIGVPLENEIKSIKSIGERTALEAKLIDGPLVQKAEIIDSCGPLSLEEEIKFIGELTDFEKAELIDTFLHTRHNGLLQ